MCRCAFGKVRTWPWRRGCKSKNAIHNIYIYIRWSQKEWNKYFSCLHVFDEFGAPRAQSRIERTKAAPSWCGRNAAECKGFFANCGGPDVHQAPPPE